MQDISFETLTFSKRSAFSSKWHQAHKGENIPIKVINPKKDILTISDDPSDGIPFVVEL